MKSNAEIIVDVLERAGTEYVFGYPGAQNTRLIEALYGSQVKFVLVTHEACAGFMADVYSRLTGKVGACLSTLGPGATNMSTGVGNAFLDRSPVLAFTATMGKRWKGRTVQMQVDHRKLFAPITKWSAEVVSGKVGSIMRKAVRIATSEPPGPVHLDLPEDTAEDLASDKTSRFRSGLPTPLPFDEPALNKAEGLIREASYPLVAIGLSMNRASATQELRAFVNHHNLPVVSTLMAKGHIDENDPHFVGVLGRARSDLVNECCRPADLVIAIGCDPVEINFETWMRKGVPLLSINTVPVDIDPDFTETLHVCGEIRPVLERLSRIPMLSHEWNQDSLAAHRQNLLAALTSGHSKFSPHRALLAMREILPDDGILVADVGAHTHVIGQLWHTRGTGNFLVSNGWSSMGFAIPAAIAAKLVRPERPVMACMGDGGFLMMVGEISTAVRLSLPVVFVVFRDNYLSLIKIRQSRRGYHSSGVELFDSRYASSHNLFGADVAVAGDEESFREALRRGLASSSPLVIEAVVDPGEYDQLL